MVAPMSEHSTPQNIVFSDDQTDAYDRVAEVLEKAGVDLIEGTTMPQSMSQPFKR